MALLSFTFLMAGCSSAGDSSGSVAVPDATGNRGATASDGSQAWSAAAAATLQSGAKFNFTETQVVEYEGSEPDQGEMTAEGAFAADGGIWFDSIVGGEFRMAYIGMDGQYWQSPTGESLDTTSATAWAVGGDVVVPMVDPRSWIRGLEDLPFNAAGDSLTATLETDGADFRDRFPRPMTDGYAVQLDATAEVDDQGFITELTLVTASRPDGAPTWTDTTTDQWTLRDFGPQQLPVAQPAS